MSDPGKVTKHQLDELGLPKPLDEFEVVDDTITEVQQESSKRETLLSRPDVAQEAVAQALQKTEQTVTQVDSESLEQIAKPENVQLIQETKQEAKQEVKQEVTTETTAPTVVAPLAPISPQVDPQLKIVEDVMTEGLKDEYEKMTPSQQMKFKEKGEETAGKILTLLRAAHVNIKKIIGLLRSWLKLIPGVNKYFLEQEAKIKADELTKITKL